MNTNKTHIDTIEEQAERIRVLVAQRDILLNACGIIRDYAKNHNMTNGGDKGHREMTAIARTAIKEYMNFDQERVSARI